MAEYVLICGSTCDLSNEYLNAINVKYIKYKYYIDDVEYLDDFGKSLSSSSFYNMLEEGSHAKTTQVNEIEHVTCFEEYLKQGIDVFYISFSSGLSGTCNSAYQAKKYLEEKYPDNKIYVVDSLAASSGYGMFVDVLADFKNKGCSIEELYKKANEIKLHINHLFFSTDLSYYLKGGRISKTAWIFGSLLKICPLLNVNVEGKLIPKRKAHGKKKSLEMMIEWMKELQEDNDYNKCFINHSDCIETAICLKEMVENNFPKYRNNIQIFDIGPTIGSHTGPGTTSIFFMGKERND